jgi:hypothetical protein
MKKSDSESDMRESYFTAIKSTGEGQIHPIPLTDELLLECGFEKNNRIDLGE